jgi:type I restriction enzyme, S subunit
MAGERRIRTLDGLYDFSSGLSKPRSAFGSGYPFLTFKDVFYNIFVPHELGGHVNSTERERELCSIKRGDIFLTRTSETMDELGMSCVALRDLDSATFNGFTKRLRPKPDAEIVPEFAGYFFRSMWFRHQVTAMASLSTRASLNNEMLGRLQMILPSILDQQAIGCVLKSLDDKIELNRRMNRTLETIAQAIFKSWFVDFDPVRAKAEGRDPGLPKKIVDLFPDTFQDSELGEIPKGWKVKSIEEVSERVAMGPFGSSIKVSTFVPDGIPVISGQHLQASMLDDSAFNFVTENHAKQLKRSNVQRGDVIFTHAGSIGQVAYIPETSRYKRYVISQRQFYMRCNRKMISPFYIVLYFKTHKGQHRLLANTSSTGVPSISQPVTYLRQLQIVIPPSEALELFDVTIGSIHCKIAHNDRETFILAALRDALLPKLISGELRVPDTERIVNRYI